MTRYKKIKSLFTIHRSPFTGAFTLIELLVVISIIGILITMSLVSFTRSQKQARDTQRKSDLKQYQTALENFANENNGLYKSRTTAVTSVTLCSDLGLTTCPQDPSNLTDSSYQYSYISDGTGGGSATATAYALWGPMETEPGNYWIVCSNGKVGKKTTAPSLGTICPL
jgi:prepilin-type N-terminal cleavage/methylation domain-containing protein